MPRKSKQGGSDIRKGGRRADISMAGSAKLLKGGAAGALSGKKVRASKDAVKKGISMLQDFLEELGDEADSSLGRQKTAGADTLAAACKKLGMPKKICKADSEKGRETLSVAGVVRYTKGHSNLERLTKAGKLKLRGIAQEYLRHVGNKAGMVSKAAKRHTLMKRDVQACF